MIQKNYLFYPIKAVIALKKPFSKKILNTSFGNAFRDQGKIFYNGPPVSKPFTQKTTSIHYNFLKPNVI